MSSIRGKARELLDTWDMKHWGRKPIADSSFQYRVREDMIDAIEKALRAERDAAYAECEKLVHGLWLELPQAQRDRAKACRCGGIVLYDRALGGVRTLQDRALKSQERAE